MEKRKTTQLKTEYNFAIKNDLFNPVIEMLVNLYISAVIYKGYSVKILVKMCQIC